MYLLKRIAITIILCGPYMKLPPEHKCFHSRFRDYNYAKMKYATTVCNYESLMLQSEAAATP